MNKNDIFAAIARHKSLNNLRPLSAIHTREDIEVSKTDGFVFGMTAEEWQERYPSLPVENIFCNKADILPSSLIYYDKEKYIYVELPMYGGQCLDAGHFEDVAVGAVRRMEDAYEKKDYLYLLMANVSEGSGNIVVGIAKEMLRREIPSPSLYDAIIGAYTLVDNAVGFTSDDIRRLKACKSPRQKRQTRNALDELPNRVTVYRGMGAASTPLDRAISWTLNESVAYFFACRRDSQHATVVKGTVPKKAIVEIIDGSEAEVLVAPDDVKVVATTHCVPMDDFLRDVANIPCAHRKGVSNPIVAVRDGIIAAYKGNTSSCHDKEHTIRVSLMAAYLFMHDFVPYAAANKFPAEHVSRMFWLLMDAVTYHDRGRVDDEEDIDHGERGYAVYTQSHPRNPIVEFLIKGHVPDDSEMEYIFRRCKIRDIPYEEAVFLYMILKDADALDRWRFGGMSRDAVRVDMLRIPTSKTLMGVAAGMQGMSLE